jgi:thiamine biosynthesis lipoprotein
VATLHRVEQVMGLPVSLHLADPAPPAPRCAELADQVYAWLRHVDAVFSTWKPDTPVSRLARGEVALSDVDGEIAGVLDRCADLWRDTDGYFDVYAGGALDPSGYVKGWAVQRASDLLTAAGAGNHQLNAGGDLVARGRPEPGRDWRIGIQHPSYPQALAWVVTGVDLVVATSGDYARGGHVLDPHTGAPATGLRSVTVVTGVDRLDLGTADAYATAAFAMGRSGAAWLARRGDLECAVVTADGRAFTTPGLPVAAPD